MRLLAYLIVLFLILSLLGRVRGWLEVETLHAGQRGTVQITAHVDQLAADERSVVRGATELSQRAIAAVKGAAQAVTAETSELAAELTAVDAVARSVTVRVGAEQLSLAVPSAAPVVVEGKSVALAALRVGRSVRLSLRESEHRLEVIRVEQES